MKKIISLLLVVVIFLSLVACGKSEEAKNVERLINAIGPVNENSKAAIIEAEQAYSALTQDDKNSIKNYNTLLDARNNYEVKNVESLINTIGPVDENSEVAIVAAENAYNVLTQENKNKVSNYNTLLDARKTYDAIPKTIELTTDNFKDFFEITCSYGKLETEKKLGITFAWVEMFLDIYPVRSGTLNNVEVTLKVTPPQSPAKWSLSSSDSAYSSVNKDTGDFTVKIRIPASGEYSETHRLGSLMITSKPSSNCTVQIVSVCGTFTEKK